MALLDIPEKKKKTTSTKYKDPLTQNVPNIKLKKGETLASLIETAKKTYPQAQIWAVEVEHFNIYKVKLNNMMELYIDKSGN